MAFVGERRPLASAVRFPKSGFFSVRCFVEEDIDALHTVVG
jgi:hypothetical protein